MRARLALVSLAACGRVSFTPLGDGGATADDGRIDDDGLTPDALPSAGLVAWFPFDSDFVDVASQVAATCTTPGCPSMTGGVVGGGISFDGTDCLTWTSTPAIEPPQLTLALFARHDVMINVSLIAKPFSSGSTNSWQLETDYADSNNLAVTFTVSENFTNTVITTPVNSVRFVTFDHIAATYDGTTKRVYINGVELANGPHPALEYDGRPLKIGCDDNGAGDGIRFEGVIDDVRIYNRALSAAEVATLAAQ